MKRVIYGWLSLLGVSTSLYAVSGKTVYEQKCSSCHEAYIPMSKLVENFTERDNRLLKLKAPTLNQLSYRLKQQIGDPKGDEDIHRMEVTAFISDYIINPDKQKTVCLRDVIRYFPTMPSLKGKISGEEIEAVSTYIYDFDTQIIEQKGVKHESFASALKEAKKSDKIIMVEAVSQHCRFCKKMEREVMIDARVVSLLRRDFVVVTVDVNKASLPMGLSAEMTPSFFFIDRDQKLLSRVVGAWNVEDFIEILKEAKAKYKGVSHEKN